MGDTKRLKPGSGWKQAAGAVWDHDSGIRIHWAGELLRDKFGNTLGMNEICRSYSMARSFLHWLTIINGGNRKRAFMIFALEMSRATY